MADIVAAAVNEHPPIAAHVQLGAVAWLRWRIFANSFRRRSGDKRRIGNTIVAVLLRLILWPIFAIWVVGPVAGSGYLAWQAMYSGRPWTLVALLTGIGFLWQFIAVNGSNIAAAMPTFDPSSLLRYPLPFGRYLLLRTALGLLTPSTVVGCLSLVAAAIGIGIADPGLAVVAFLSIGLYAAMNVFLARMIAIWLERVLAARRVRELFGAVLAIFFLSFQFLQYAQPRHGGHERQSWLITAAMRSAHAMHWLPPGYAADAVLAHGHTARMLADLLLLAAWTAAFLAGFAYRLHKQFLGEYLSETVPVRATRVAPLPRQLRATGIPNTTPPSAHRSLLPPIVPAVLRKEWLTIRGNSAQLMGLLTPLIFVVILSRGMFAHHPAYLLPGAVGYAILGPLAAVYNMFGPDGAGVQMYLLAPVRVRDVVVAKNVASLLLLSVEAALAWTLAVCLSHAPIPAASQVGSLLWLVFVLAINLALGTLRSIQAPSKFVPGQSRKMRAAPTNRTSALLVLAVVIVSILAVVPVVWVGRHFHAPWLPVSIFAALAAVGVAAYALLLHNVDALMLRHRDVLEQELCGVS